MTFNAYQLPPPADWQAFERFSLDLFAAIWNDPFAQMNGRAGQAQAGVDVSGTNSVTGKLEGVQCKGKDGRYGHSVTVTELQEEVKKALTFTPAISHYYLVTSGVADVTVQAAARKITDNHKQSGKFAVTVLAWDELVNRLEPHTRVARKHFRALHLALAEIYAPAELIAICHQSFQRTDGLFHRVDPIAAADGFHPILMDATRYLDDGVLDVRAAIHRQRHLFQSICEKLDAHPAATVAYFGISHIPLVMHAGTAASTKTGIRLYELEGTTGAWQPLLEDNACPDLGVELIDEGGPSDYKNAVIRVEVSARVSVTEVGETLGGPFRSFVVRIKEPKRGVVTHQVQATLIAHAFREALDIVQNENPKSRRHVFAAVPVSVAFRLGQMVNPNMHRSVIAYNYSQLSVPPYHWAVDLVARDTDPQQLWTWEGKQIV
jgi:hypothetical protein